MQQGGKNSGKGLNNINRNRRSIRLHGYDYSRAGAYFVTICTRNRACLFGEIIDGEMVLDDSGAMVETVWNELPDRFPNIDLDAFIIMPNHIHGIIVLVGAPLVGAHPGNVAHLENGIHPGNGTYVVTVGRATTRVAPTLGDVAGAFKSLVTVEYTRGVKQSGWACFDGKLWQRNYYEHIIRDENELNRIRTEKTLLFGHSTPRPNNKEMNHGKHDIPYGHDAPG